MEKHEVQSRHESIYDAFLDHQDSDARKELITLQPKTTHKVETHKVDWDLEG